MRSWLIFVSILILQGSITSSLQAQTWSDNRNRPALWQIISVDATGETGWPYGEEDVAGDGSGQFSTEEASVDLRSVYATADGDRLWLRAYVSLESSPPASAMAFVFIDADGSQTTGGTAAATEIWPDFDEDPTDGGFERAIGIRGDGTLIGVWRFNEQNANWTTQPDQAGDVNVEVGVDRDPVLIAAERHGYFQVDAAHQITGLTATCDGSILLRLWNDDPPDNGFGDDDSAVAACRVATGANGDPAVLVSAGCTSDAECPADGICYEGTCYFAYSCSTDADCRSGETCSNGVCVRVVDAECQDNADCDGLVCDSGVCVACSDSGARACDSGYFCAPNGSCIAIRDTGTDGGVVAGSGGSVSPGARDSGTEDGLTAGSGGSDSPGPDVQGGAFHCGVATGGTEASGAAFLLLICFLVLSTRRHLSKGP